MANKKANPQAPNNDPHWGAHPSHLSGLMNQHGKSQSSGGDQSMNKALPQLMNQGGSTKHASAHAVGHGSKGPAMHSLMGQ